MKKDTNNFLSLFKSSKPIIGMIHLKGDEDMEILTRAIREIDIYTKNGIDAVLIENYFGEIKNVEYVLEYIANYRKNVIYGVNILGDYKRAFALADTYHAKFIQIDSVAGHLRNYNDKIFENNIKLLRSNSNAFLIGGVRFKYQPYLSGKSLEEDLEIGIERCDAIVVTGEGTGKVTDLEKIKNFRKIIGQFPLVVGAGLTTQNCTNQLSIADAGIVGSYLKENHVDYGEVSSENTENFMNKVKILRR